MIKKIFILLLGIIVFWSCEEIVVDQDNPLDPGNPDYESPIVNIISGPPNGETIATSEVTFIWEGNDLITEYRTSFLNDPWGDWADHTSITLQYLDEGSYSFSVQGRYSSGDTSAVVTNNFAVDAVQGPALMFYPRANFSSVGSNVNFQVRAEDVNNLTAVQFNVTFDPSKLEIVSVAQGSFFLDFGESIFSFDFDNQTGSLSVVTAALGGDQPSGMGTGPLLELVLEVKAAGTSYLEFDGTELFRDPDNNDITINETVDGLVVVE
jgi:hypothetical protein